MDADEEAGEVTGCGGFVEQLPQSDVLRPRGGNFHQFRQKGPDVREPAQQAFERLFDSL